MSTKAIREALEVFREKAQGDEPALWEAALAEVQAIEKAAGIVAVQGIHEAEYDDAATRSEVARAEELFFAIAEETKS